MSDTHVDALRRLVADTEVRCRVEELIAAAREVIAAMDADHRQLFSGRTLWAAADLARIVGRP